MQFNSMVFSVLMSCSLHVAGFALMRGNVLPLRWGTEHQQDRDLGANGKPLSVVISTNQVRSENSKKHAAKVFDKGSSDRKSLLVQAALVSPSKQPEDIAKHRMGKQTGQVSISKLGVIPAQSRGSRVGKIKGASLELRAASSNSASTASVTTSVDALGKVVPPPKSDLLVGENQAIFANGDAVRLLGSLLPEYPPKARRLGWEGTSHLEAVIDKNGNVAKVLMTRTSGFDELDSAAIKALSEARFSKPWKAGFSSTVTKKYRVRFQLTGITQESSE